MTKVLNVDLLKDFADNFYQYGDFGGPYWFIGMEERGAENFDNVMARLAAWQTRGRPEIDDVAEFHQEADMGHLFDAKAPIQPTWRQLIAVLLHHQGKTVTSETIRHYQVSDLARTGKETCLLELLPLPAPGAGNSSWPYGNWTKQAPFQNKTDYIQHYVHRRADYLEQLIAKHIPKVVMLYGISHKRWFEKIANVPLAEPQQNLLVGRDQQTVFTITYHPVAKGINPTQYFHAVADAITAASRRPLTRQEFVRQELKRLVCETRGLCFDYPWHPDGHASDSYVRVAYQPWDDAVSPVRDSKRRWTHTGRMLLFTFANLPQGLRMSLEVGPGPDAERERLLGMAHCAPSLLKREDGEPTKWGTWSVLFRRDIVPPDTFSTASDADITNALTEFWDAFVNDYLPQIDKAAQQLHKK
jgi:hypothetical protein